jgi:hypothetical protein
MSRCRRHQSEDAIRSSLVKGNYEVLTDCIEQLVESCLAGEIVAIVADVDIVLQRR